MELLIGRSLDYETKLHPYIDEGNSDLSNREENKMIDLSSDLSSSDDSDLLNSDQVDSKLETILICVGDFLEFSKMTHNGEIPEDHLALSNEIRAQANKVQADLEKAQQDQANQEFSCFLQEADEILTSLKNNSFYKEFETNRALLLEDPNESENDKQSTLSIIQEVKQKLLLLSNIHKIFIFPNIK